MQLTLLLDPLYYYGEQYELTLENVALGVVLLLPLAAAGLLLRWALWQRQKQGAQARQRGSWVSIFTSLALMGYLLYWILGKML